jgi:hypothetical protein
VRFVWFDPLTPASAPTHSLHNAAKQHPGLIAPACRRGALKTSKAMDLGTRFGLFDSPTPAPAPNHPILRPPR